MQGSETSFCLLTILFPTHFSNEDTKAQRSTASLGQAEMSQEKGQPVSGIIRNPVSTQ